MWTRNIAAEQLAAIDSAQQKRRLKAVRDAREAKAKARQER